MERRIEEGSISNMPIQEFGAITDGYIERKTKDAGELDASLFHEALREMLGRLLPLRQMN